jgi:hypothetical protein
MSRLWAGVAALAFIAYLPPVLAQEVDAECPQGEGWLECRAAAGDRLAIYRLGRTAYEEARETGDFSEPLRMGRELAYQNDKNGERLLKMVHLQLSWGNHKDYVQAYDWMVEDQSKGFDYLDPLIGNLAEKMTPEQLANVQQLADE